MADMNVIHHINELKKVLAYSKNIGFFLGAGSSCAFGLPSIYTLTNEVKDKLDPNSTDIYEKAAEDIKALNGGRDATIEDITTSAKVIHRS